MQTIPKGRPVPIIRRTLKDPVANNTARDMGQIVLPDNPRTIEESNRQAHLHNSHIKAAIKTPEEERRRFHMTSPSPNAYHGGHFSPKPSPVVRPQSAMALTSPQGNNNNNGCINNYNNSYGKAVTHQRPPSSLGIRQQPMHQHSRSFGDGITSEQVFTDRLPPRDIATDAYQRRNRGMEPNKSPLPPRGNQTGPRGSYNPYYASNMDLNSRTGESHTEKVSHDKLQYTDTQDLGARTKSSTPIATSHDLRSAWQRLYGQSFDSSGRRPSTDHVTQPISTHRQGDGDYQRSPRPGTRSPYPSADINTMQNQPVRMVPRGKQVAGPMATPYNNTGRQTPPGQCSNNQNPHPHSFNNSTEQQNTSFSSSKPAIKNFRTPQHDPEHSLGPSAKYPDPDIGVRKPLRYDDVREQNQGNTLNNTKEQVQQVRNGFGGSRENGMHRQSHRYTHNDAYCSETEIDADDEPDILPTDSIFDYAKSESDEESITPRHSNTARKGSHHNIDPPPYPKNEKNNNVMNLKEVPKPSERRHTDLNTHYARSRSLEDVRESGDDVSNVSFDVENTFLMVDPSDQSEMGTLRSKNSDVKTKLNRLEGMYTKVMKTLETRSPKESRGRRWSIGSSDTNSIRHQVHQHSKHGRSSNQRMSNREIKSVNKRFQRLESHVITLARSIAHISSELRTQTTMSREIENVKREIQEMKLSKNNGNGEKDRKRQDFDKYRGYNHPLTNPKQVNKLTRFFGQEPSWLEIFLTRLGYEQYVKNFHQEHIGMMELPYMTDDQLKSIGIPMGPRTRILQESQMCFKDDNFNIYIV